MLASPAAASPGPFAGCDGEIIDTASGQKRAFEELAGKISARNIVLFGERHGTQAHAAAAACVLAVLSAHAAKTSLVMEMLSVADQTAIDAWRRRHPEFPEGLGTALEWWKRGWPAFETWSPLLEMAYARRARLLGGDLAPADARARELTSDEVTALRNSLGAHFLSVRQSWRQAMIQAHCGLLDEQEVKQLTLLQMRRDASIAAVALEALRGGGRVLVHAGRGHVRRDRSLFRSLKAPNAASTRSPLTIAAFAAQEEIMPDDRQAFDLIWITGSLEPRKAACDEMGLLTTKGGEIKDATDVPSP